LYKVVILVVFYYIKSFGLVQVMQVIYHKYMFVLFSLSFVYNCVCFGIGNTVFD